MIMACLGLLVGTLFAPDKQLVTKNQASTTQDFDNGTGEIQLLSQEYDSKNHTMILNFQTKDAQINTTSTTPLGINFKQLKWNIYSQPVSKAEMEILPILDNKISIIVKNVDPQFKILALDITNNSVARSDINTGLTQNNQSNKSNELYFFITENSKFLKHKNISVLTQQDFGKIEINNEINSQNKIKLDLYDNIDKLNKAIAEDKQKIDDLNSKQTFLVGQDLTDNKDSIVSIQGDIQTLNQQIQTARDNIKVVDNRLISLDNQLKSIQNGTYKFPNKIQSQDIKNKR